MTKQSIAIVGCGAVGKSIYNDLLKQNDKYQLSIFNSTTISRAFKKSFDVLIYAGVPGVKWKANAFPEEDLEAAMTAEKQFKQIKADKKILISTIDADNKDSGVYGAHRHILESKVLKDENVAVVRLPALVGKEVVKNQWYDIYNPLPRVMNKDMTAKLNTVISLLTDRNDIYIENSQPDNAVIYHPSKEEFAKFNFGMHLASNPYSKMLWLNIDDLGSKLMSEYVDFGYINLFASEFKGEPALLEIYEMYRATTHENLPKLTGCEAKKYPCPKIDHSKHVDNATFVNTVVFKRGGY